MCDLRSVGKARRPSFHDPKLEAGETDTTQPPATTPPVLTMDTASSTIDPTASQIEEHPLTPPTLPALPTPVLMQNHTLPRLRFLCVGTGRDGTRSLHTMLQDMFDQEARGRQSYHEYEGMTFNDAFCEVQETSCQQPLDRVRSMFRECPFDAIVGNGYAPVLQQAADVLGPDVNFDTSKKTDKSAFIRSFTENIELFPRNHKYYSKMHIAEGKRNGCISFWRCNKRRME